MQIELGPEERAIVERLLATGRYASAEAIVAEAVLLLHLRQERGPDLDDSLHTIERSLG